MKYGILTRSNPRSNIGDVYQTNGIKRVYERMGIRESELVKIDMYSLPEYEGEYVVLPLAGYMDALGAPRFPLSPRIIPVFIGTHCIDDEPMSHLLQYRHFGPFGCRDEDTMKKLRQNGLDAYMSGCLSICVEKRAQMSTQKKVFLVDISEKLRQKIPAELLMESVETTHVYNLHKCGCTTREEREAKINEIAEETLERYKREARLVITSRLHCALPCVAMGIPTIVAKEPQIIESRFSGLDKILNYYSESEFDKINFDLLPPPDIEWLKEKVMDLAEYMIKSAYEKYSRLCEISQFYEERPCKVYHAGIKDGYLTLKQKRDFYEDHSYEKEILSYIVGKNIEDLSLVVFGVGEKARLMLRRYRKKIKRFKEVFFIDSKKSGQTFFEFKVESPEILYEFNREKLMVIVATDTYYSDAGRTIGEDLINVYQLKEGKEFFYLDKLNNSMNLPLDACGTVKYWGDIM